MHKTVYTCVINVLHCRVPSLNGILPMHALAVSIRYYKVGQKSNPREGYFYGPPCKCNAISYLCSTTLGNFSIRDIFTVTGISVKFLKHCLPGVSKNNCLGSTYLSFGCIIDSEFQIILNKILVRSAKTQLVCKQVVLCESV